VSRAEAIGAAPQTVADEGSARWAWAAASLVLLLALGGLVRFLDVNVPIWLSGVS
jgi:hypothetical protein